MEVPGYVERVIVGNEVIVGYRVIYHYSSYH